MREAMDQELEQYTARLRELPFIKDVRIRLEPDRGPGPRPDADLVLTTPEGDYELLVETKRTHLTYATADYLLAMWQNAMQHNLWTNQQHLPRPQKQPWILFAPYVPPKIGQHLADEGANYIDLEGNCRLRLGDRYIAAIEGRVPERKDPEGRGLRAAGYQVLFAILAKPELLDEGVVKIGDLAGAGKTTAADTLEKLEREGFLTTIQNHRRLVRPGALLDRWLVGYANAVRPRLLVGRYRTQDKDPEELERRVEDVLGNDTEWAWGGGAAAMKLTQHYRGETTILHMAKPHPDLTRRLRAQRDADGPLVLLKAPGRLAFDGVLPRTVHPLLIYTELLATGNERAREAALDLRQRYLGELD
jgi:hypothetical protein